jgi:xanthine/uracil permease
MFAERRAANIHNKLLLAWHLLVARLVATYRSFMRKNAFAFMALSLPRSRARRKPADIVYAASDTPAGGLLLALAGQHTAMAVALSAYALVAAKLADLSVGDTQSFLACTILGMAAATFLQAWGGRLGAGALLVHIPDPLMVPFIAVILREYGLGGMLLFGVAAGLPIIGFSRLLPHLRFLFPPAVLGVVVCMGGFSLIEGALRHALGLGRTFVIDPTSALIACVTLGIIIAFSIWGTRTMKLFGLLAGILAGVVVSGIFGRLEGFSLFAAAPAMALPKLAVPVFNVDPVLIVAVVIVALLGQFDTFAGAVIVDKMDDADWKRPDMTMVGGSFMANGLGNLVAGVLGGMPNGVSSANIGLSHAMRSTSRMVGIFTAILIALLAMLPKVTLALTLIPTAVIGAVEVYAAAFLIVSGIELAASRALDSRGVFMIGISLIVGLGTMLMPELARNVPDVLHYVVGSGFVMAGMCAVLLNLLFRFGTSMEARLPLDDDPDTSRVIVDFIEAQGGIWQARRDVVSRAALAALETAELVAGYGQNRKTSGVLARFDEFNFDVEITHSGAPLVLGGSQTPDLVDLMDADDDATRIAMAQISGVLVQRLADKVRTGTRNGSAFVSLHFSH